MNARSLKGLFLGSALNKLTEKILRGKRKPMNETGGKVRGESKMINAVLGKALQMSDSHSYIM